MKNRINAKRIVILLFICIFIIVGLTPIKTYAAEKMGIELEDVKGKAGEEITVNVRLVNNPGVRVLGGKISFDKDKLEYINCELQNLEKAAIKDIQYNENTGNIVFYATTRTNEDETIKDNDIIAKIKLKIKENASGTAEVKLAMDDVAISINQTITDFTQKNATVTIEGNTGSNKDNISGSTEGSTENPSINNNESNNEENGQENNEETSNNGENNGENNNEANETNNQNLKEENKTEEQQGNLEHKNSPTTGDIAVGILIALAIISLIGITVILIKRKKKKE